jgi:hypothetical protein
MRYCGALFLGGLLIAGAVSQEKQPAAVEESARKATAIHSVFAVNPRLVPAIREKIVKARTVLQEHRQQRHVIAYLSTPISSRGGGHSGTNVAIAAFVKAQLEARYGPRLWVLDPGQFPSLQGQVPEPQGGDYQFLWSEILAGQDGLARDFDMVYFIGPSDVRAYFASLGANVHANWLDELNRCVDERAQRDERFRQEVASKSDARHAFMRFYGIRASTVFSLGAHDEWNLFVRINRKRGVGDQIAMYFDGRALSPGEMETEIKPGYELSTR